MPKRWLCGLLSALMLFSSLMPSALADDSYVYDPVTFVLLSDHKAWTEREFRQMVRDACTLYLDKYYDPSKGPARYYYSASNAKADFDAETYLWGDRNDNLAFNTNAEVSDREYEKETREVITYMLAKDIQEKVTEMEYMSQEERQAIVPGVVYDATTGKWAWNQQAAVSQAIEDEEVAEAIAKGVAESEILFWKAASDTLIAFAGGETDNVLDLTNDISEAIKNIWVKAIEERYKKERAVLQNIYRQAMINDLMAAQQNVDDQIFGGMYDIKALLEKQKNKSKEDDIMLDCIDELLDAVSKAQTEKAVLKHQYASGNGYTTFDDQIKAIAEEMVNNMGLTEEEYMDEQRIIVELLAVAVKDTLVMGVGKALEGEVSDYELFFIEESLDKALSGLLLASERENWDTNHNKQLELNEILVAFGKHVSMKTLNEIIKDAISKVSLGAVLSNAQKEYDEKSEKYRAIRDKYEKKGYKLSKSRANNLETEVKHAREKLDKERKENEGFIKALVDNAISLVESAVDWYLASEDLFDSGRNETTISFIASTMYRTRQLADKARITLQLDYAKYFADATIETAPVEELREFLNCMYTVISTDLQGQSYYATLVAWYDAQHDPGEFARNKALAEQLYSQKKQAAWEKNVGLGIGWTMLGWLYKGIYVYAAEIESMDSRYLDSVSWTSFTTSVDKYNEIGEDLSSFTIDASYELLFK